MKQMFRMLNICQWQILQAMGLSSQFYADIFGGGECQIPDFTETQCLVRGLTFGKS